MELHQLRYAVAVARAGNFSRAAEQCHVSQPSLSQQIHKLEDELGERLFDRLSRQARLTPVGQRFLDRAARVLEELDIALREARAEKELTQGRAVLGVLPTIAPYLLPEVISAFSRQFPGVEIVVHEDTTARLLNLAAAGDADLLLASLPIKDPRFEVCRLFTEELLLALPADHPLASKRTISTDDLERERFILMQEGHCLGDQILRFCTRRDFHPQVSCRSAQIETVQALVQAGLGISLIPKMARRPDNAGHPVYRSLCAPRPARTIVALWLRQRPPGRAVKEFLKCLVAHLAASKS